MNSFSVARLNHDALQHTHPLRALGRPQTSRIFHRLWIGPFASEGPSAHNSRVRDDKFYWVRGNSPRTAAFTGMPKTLTTANIGWWTRKKLTRRSLLGTSPWSSFYR